jgi:DeoR/GlpR family transcriptional regulator of sugar metabolism
MLREERHNIILQQIALHKKVLTSALCALLNVSIDTVRRDLTELEKNARLVKVHGGAISVHYHDPFQPPVVYAQAEKKEIAKKALTLLRNGMVILTGGGTVMLEFARMIPEDLLGTLFTVSPLVALEAAQRSSLDVILLAGRLSRNSYVCTGSSVVSQLSELTVDLCFMGTNGISLKEGITDNDWEIVQVKKAMLKSAERTALLSISEKIGTTQKIQVCPLNSVHYLITELDRNADPLSQYADVVKTI